MVDRINARYKKDLEEGRESDFHFIDQVKPRDSDEPIERSTLSPMQVFDNRVARQKRAQFDAERVANEKVIFADEGTLQSWLEKIVELNEIEIVSRVKQG